MKSPALVALLAIAATIMTACATSEHPSPRLRLDINCTYSAPIEVVSLTQENAVDTLTAEPDGTYYMSLAGLSPDIYRLGIDGEYLDIVVEQPEDINIVARRNYLSEATTDHQPTQKLWKMQAFKQRLNSVQTVFKQRLNAAKTLYEQNSNNAAVTDSINRVAAAMNKLMHEAREEATAMIAEADSSIVALAVLNIKVGGRPVFDLAENSALYLSTLRKLRPHYPDNKLMADMEAQVKALDQKAQFRRKYAKGKPCPALTFVNQYGQENSTAQLVGQRYVVFFSTDSTQQVRQVWQTIAQLRHKGRRMVGLMPAAVDREPKTTTTYGTRVQGAALSELQQHQPLVWAVDAEGNIERLATEATMSDMGGEW